MEVLDCIFPGNPILCLSLDTSVILAASGSAREVSRFIIRSASTHRWSLVTAGYCVGETERILLKLGASAVRAWERLSGRA